MTMIQYLTGSVLEAKTEALVNPVDTVGVMGAGLALQFKLKFPDNFNYYKQQCKLGNLKIGNILIYKTLLPQPKYILNFPTKQHYKDPSKLEYIESGISTLRKIIIDKNIQSIAIPKLRCGLGNLEF